MLWLTGVPLLRLRLRRGVPGHLAGSAAQPDGGDLRVALLQRGAVYRGRSDFPRPPAQLAHRRSVLAAGPEPPQDDQPPHQLHQTAHPR